MTSAVGSFEQLETIERSAAVPWYLYTLALGATSIIVGVLWDISWHSTIGRDTFWTPAHIAIYLGGILAGSVSGWLVLRHTFFSKPEEQQAAVSVFGLRAPLGAWVT